MIFLAHPLKQASGGTLSGTVLGLPTWLVALAIAAVLLSVLLGRSGGGKRKSGGGKGGRGGRIGGLPVLLVVGLLIGATAFGGSAVRTVVTAIVHAVTTVGGLFGG